MESATTYNYGFCHSEGSADSLFNSLGGIGKPE